MKAADRKILDDFDAAEAEIKQALADLKILRSGRRTYDRFHLVTDALWRATEMVRGIEDDLDIFGTKKRAAEKAANARLLPAPGSTEAQT